MADIVYTYGNSVYMNITNKCPCSCVFCIRSNGDGLGSKYLKEKYGLKIRLNSNGLSDLINGKETAKLLEGIVDSISISLNAPNAKRYQEVSRSRFGEDAFPALLKFAEDCKKYIPKIKFTVVDVLNKEEIAECQKIADNMGIPLRVREWIK